MKYNTFGLIIASFFALSSFTGDAAGQGGPLDPTGPPGATMRSLYEVEPRTPLIDGASGVSSNDVNYEFVISGTGSYYLTGNLDVTRTHGVAIQAEGVTLDLMGFSIRRTGGGAGGNAVEIDPKSDRCAIRNGAVTGGAIGFENGIEAIFSGGFPRNGSLSQLSVSGCTGRGISTGEGWQLQGCKAHDNPGTGIRGGTILTDCAAYGNGSDGFNIFVGSTVNNCSSRDNGGSGFFVSAGSSLLNCSATKNIENGIEANSSSLENCTSRDNDGDGFTANRGCAMINCSAQINDGDGIELGSECIVRGGAFEDNQGAGIRVRSTGGNNRVDGNHVTGNLVGIEVESADNLIVRNSVSINTTNFNIVGGNTVGPTVTSANIAASDNPHANYEF